MAGRERADLVVVGAGTIGGWAATFAREDGVGRVVVLERDIAGGGASSRAAGIVRAQGGTPATVALGRWTIAFFHGQAAHYGTDSGFRELGYLILATTAGDERAGRARVAMQRAVGLDVRWLSSSEACAEVPTLAPDGHRGGSFIATDGAIDPPRNVLAYSLAMRQTGRSGIVGDGDPRVLLTGGPTLRAVGRVAGVRIPAGAVRHQVAVTEPHPAFAVARQPMVFDLGRGLYWRLEDGGLLFGMSNPDEPPGAATEIDLPYLRRMRRRLDRFVPAARGLGLRRAWAATIDFTPDHLPILGPALDAAGAPIDGLWVASPGGHGMMWGPAVSRVAADLVASGRTDLVDLTDLGLDRFDADGRSRIPPDAIALPFPGLPTD